jgi:tRNA 2-thiouridine synthesizing protein A
MTQTILDLKGLKCPLPALKARKALKSVLPGRELMVICTDPMAAIDIPNLIRETGDVLLSQASEAGIVTFVIKKGE